MQNLQSDPEFLAFTEQSDAEWNGSMDNEDEDGYVDHLISDFTPYSEPDRYFVPGYGYV